MPKITGLGYTRRDKVFAEFEIDGSIYTFKESHSSKNRLYKVGIYKDGNKLYKIDMDREQINRIKDNKGIANIEFLSAKGFEDWVENNYFAQTFRAKQFQEHFETWFIDRFKFLQTEDDPQVEYISYLMGNVPQHLLEDFYNQNKVDLSKTFRYLDIAYTSEAEEARNLKYQQMLDRIEAELKQYMNVHGIEYLDKDNFRNSINRSIVESGYERFKEERRTS